MLKTKSVHSPIEPGDGLRLLVTRFHGRGRPADRYDVWMANLGPSERLLKAVQAGEIMRRGFSKNYREELFAPAATDGDNATIKNHGQKFMLRLLGRLAVTPEGLPLAYEMSPGNTADKTTLRHAWHHSPSLRCRGPGLGDGSRNPDRGRPHRTAHGRGALSGWHAQGPAQEREHKRAA